MKNPNTLRTIISASFIFIFCIGFSQDKKASNFNAEISLDIVSSYVWRGIDYQHNGSLQPYLALSWKKGGTKVPVPKRGGNKFPLPKRN